MSGSTYGVDYDALYASLEELAGIYMSISELNSEFSLSEQSKGNAYFMVTEFIKEMQEMKTELLALVEATGTYFSSLMRSLEVNDLSAAAGFGANVAGTGGSENGIRQGAPGGMADSAKGTTGGND